MVDYAALMAKAAAEWDSDIEHSEQSLPDEHCTDEERVRNFIQARFGLKSVPQILIDRHLANEGKDLDAEWLVELESIAKAKKEEETEESISGLSGKALILAREMLALSKSHIWGEARKEWYVWDIYESPQNTCLCTHHPITEVCILRNSINDNEARVGNCCVTKFTTHRPDLVMANIRRLRDDLSKGVRKELVDLALKRHWINEWEADFCSNTQDLRILSPRREATRLKINRRILSYFDGQNKAHPEEQAQ